VKCKGAQFEHEFAFYGEATDEATDEAIDDAFVFDDEAID
jgi:hypothetical protein